jgi:hypothetical protein
MFVDICFFVIKCLPLFHMELVFILDTGGVLGALRYLVPYPKCIYIYREFQKGLYSGIPNVQSRSYFTTDGRSVNMSWYRAPLWDLRPDITSCRNVSV